MVPGFRCWQSPWRGLFHNLGHSQGLLVDLAQIPLADGVACSQSVDCSSGGLTTEISGSETPRFLQDVWPDHGRSRGFPSSLHSKEVTQARLCSPHFLQDNWRGLGGRADPPTRHACVGKCRRMLTGWISHVGWARYSHVKGLGQGWWVHTHNPAELTVWVQRVIRGRLFLGTDSAENLSQCLFSAAPSLFQYRYFFSSPKYFAFPIVFSLFLDKELNVFWRFEILFVQLLLHLAPDLSFLHSHIIFFSCGEMAWVFEAGPNAKSIRAHCCTCHGIRAQQVRVCWARSLPPAPYQTLNMLWALQPQHKGRSDVLLILN